MGWGIALTFTIVLEPGAFTEQQRALPNAYHSYGWLSSPLSLA